MSKIDKFPVAGRAETRCDPWREAVGRAIENVYENPGCGYSILAIWFGHRLTAYWVVFDGHANLSLPAGHKWSLALWVAPRECWATPTMHPFALERGERDA